MANMKSYKVRKTILIANRIWNVDNIFAVTKRTCNKYYHFQVTFSTGFRIDVSRDEYKFILEHANFKNVKDVYPSSLEDEDEFYYNENQLGYIEIKDDEKTIIYMSYQGYSINWKIK